MKQTLYQMITEELRLLAIDNADLTAEQKHAARKSALVQFIEQVDPDLSPSAQAKAYGAKSLKAVADYYEKPVQTLINWRRNSPALFRSACIGYVITHPEGEQ